MKNATSFQPGKSGNPGGRPKAHMGLAKSILDATRNGDEVRDILLGIARDVAVDPRTRVAACKELLDRGVGKAAQTIDVQIEDEAPEISIDEYLRGLSPDQRNALETVLGSSTEH